MITKQKAMKALMAIERSDHWCVGEGLCSQCNAINILEEFITEAKENDEKKIQRKKVKKDI